jgi:hypothetical protein
VTSSPVACPTGGAVASRRPGTAQPRPRPCGSRDRSDAAAEDAGLDRREPMPIDQPSLGIGAFGLGVRGGVLAEEPDRNPDDRALGERISHGRSRAPRDNMPPFTTPSPPLDIGASGLNVPPHPRWSQSVDDTALAVTAVGWCSRRRMRRTRPGDLPLPRPSPARICTGSYKLTTPTANSSTYTSMPSPRRTKSTMSAMASIGPKRADGTYRARYRDAAGCEHSRHFRRKIDARHWLGVVPNLDRGLLHEATIDGQPGQGAYQGYRPSLGRCVWAMSGRRK